MDACATDVQQMPRLLVARVDIVDADQIVRALRRKGNNIAVEQHHGNAGGGQRARDQKIAVFAVRVGLLVRDEENAGNPLRAETRAKGIDRGRGVQRRGGAVRAPNQAQVAGVAGLCDLGADRFEKLGVA